MDRLSARAASLRAASSGWQRGKRRVGGHSVGEQLLIAALTGGRSQASRTLSLLLARRHVPADPGGVSAVGALRGPLLVLHAPQLPPWPARQRCHHLLRRARHRRQRRARRPGALSRLPRLLRLPLSPLLLLVRARIAAVAGPALAAWPLAARDTADTSEAAHQRRTLLRQQRVQLRPQNFHALQQAAPGLGLRQRRRRRWRRRRRLHRLACHKESEAV